ncbi:MAG TPA: hotdog domain-containing protein [Steroidobacteraceae bacterium]
METLKPGMKGTFSLKVERKHCTSRGGPWVFSTPEMVKFSELSCHQLVEPMLGAGENSVGVTVHIRHLAPTLEGQTVRSEVELIEVDRRRLKFKVDLFDELDRIGECEHERFVTDVAKSGERQKAKAQKLGIALT